VSGREAAHALRGALGAMRTWSRVLEGRLAASGDPVVLRALEGLREAIAQQVDVIETQLEAGRRAPVAKRKARAASQVAGKKSKAVPDT
jgi:hypothetical protein